MKDLAKKEEADKKANEKASKVAKKQVEPVDQTKKKKEIVSMLQKRSSNEVKDLESKEQLKKVDEVKVSKKSVPEIKNKVQTIEKAETKLAPKKNCLTNFF